MTDLLNIRSEMWRQSLNLTNDLNDDNMKLFGNSEKKHP